uniref:Uncharacterized protein n=1 Tax=Anguilla anguilla TaxID=7936 RepID=A0A0E9SPP0_ANGAN
MHKCDRTSNDEIQTKPCGRVRDSSSSSVRLDTLLTTCASPGIELSLVTQRVKVG